MKYLSIVALSSLGACSSLNESLQLGAGMGAVAGATASYSANQTAGGTANLEDVAIGAGVGLGLGLITSYIVHKTLVEEPRPYKENESPQMHFGDLPPSPFIMPPTAPRRNK